MIQEKHTLPLPLDINECSINNGGCSANAQCTNVIGGTRTCACNTGYTGDGLTCTGEVLTCFCNKSSI